MSFAALFADYNQKKLLDDKLLDFSIFIPMTGGTFICWFACIWVYIQ